jgi:hypothetical protein
VRPRVRLRRSLENPYCLRIRSTWTDSRYPVQVKSCPPGATPLYGFAVIWQLMIACSAAQTLSATFGSNPIHHFLLDG